MPAKSNFEVAINSDAAIPVSGRKEMQKLARAAMLSGDSVTIYRDGLVSETETAKYNKRANDAFKSQMFVQLTRRSYQLSSLVKDWNNGMSEKELATELDDIRGSLRDLYDMVARRLDFDPFEEEISDESVSQQV